LRGVGNYQGTDLDMRISVVDGTVLRMRVQDQGFLEMRVPGRCRDQPSECVGALLKMEIFEKGTQTPVTIPDLHFTVFDIDGCKDTSCPTTYGRNVAGLEELRVCSTHTPILTTNTKVTPGTSGGCSTYTSTLAGALDNQPYTTAIGGNGYLSDKAKDLSTELVFKNVQEFEMGYKVREVDNDFRTMLINGYGEITECKQINGGIS